MVEKDDKTANDRTWCFWETKPGPFDSLVSHQWEMAWFHGPGFSKKLDLSPFQYKMIRSAKFYAFVKETLSQNPNFQIIRAEVDGMFETPTNAIVQTSLADFEAELVFSSIPEPVNPKSGEFYLLQHFMGWFVEMEKPVFLPNEPILMDFRIPQNGDCRFIYQLPESSHKALVEYTVFSPEILKKEDYRDGLRTYLNQHFPKIPYQIVEEEFGIIPMYSETSNRNKSRRIIPIGTAGGATKASTGYTFTRIQKHSARLTQTLANENPQKLNGFEQSLKYQWFDRVLLHVLSQKNHMGASIFEGLFRKNSPKTVFRFLDENSSLGEEWNVMQSVPILEFLWPGLKELKNLKWK